jgi:hypothetical protein
MNAPMARHRAALSVAAILVVIIGAVAWALFHQPWARAAAGIALVLYVINELSGIKAGARRMLVGCVLATMAALAFHPDPGAVLTKALSEASFMIGLFSALGMLRDTAESSALVRRCGEMMVRQPPGRRYMVLAMGSHIISLTLNFGVLPLLGIMVTHGNTLDAAGGDERIQRIRTQRMMTAIMRGFTMMTVWSPLSISFTVTQGAVHGLDWWALLQLQLVLTVLLMGLGWLLDRRAFPRTATPAPTPTPDQTTPGWRPLIRMTLLIAGIVVCSVALAEALSVRLVIGAMIVVPASAVVWLFAQQEQWRPAVLGRALSGFGGRLAKSLPAMRYEVAMLGGAMYFGAVVSAFIPPELTAKFIAMLPFPPVVVMIVLAWAVMGLAQLGISQIISVTLLGSALGSLAHAGIHPLVLASGMMGAWGLSACSTPVGAAVLTVARMAGVTSRDVAIAWNGWFVVGGALILALWMAALSLVLT